MPTLSNPFEQTLWIKINTCPLLQLLALWLLSLGVLALWSSSLSNWIKIVSTLAALFCFIPQFYRLSGQLPKIISAGLAKDLYKAASPRQKLRIKLFRKFTPVTGLRLAQDRWWIECAGMGFQKAQLIEPVWRWPFLIFLRFTLYSDDQCRYRIGLLLTPWQIDRDHFRWLYSRLGWLGSSPAGDLPEAG